MSVRADHSNMIVNWHGTLIQMMMLIGPKRRLLQQPGLIELLSSEACFS